MIMIESVDSLVTISSQDLWAEICASFPYPNQNGESSDEFADSFTDCYVPNDIMDTSFQTVDLKPWAPLMDSEVYLASLGCQELGQRQELIPSCNTLEVLTCRPHWELHMAHGQFCPSPERRLMRIKGLSQEVTSKDMLHTLSQAKRECWDRFLQDNSESESDFYMEGAESDESTLEHLKRWLQPDKVAISSEEMQYLIPLEPGLEKQESEEESMAIEQ